MLEVKGEGLDEGHETGEIERLMSPRGLARGAEEGGKPGHDLSVVFSGRVEDVDHLAGLQGPAGVDRSWRDIGDLPRAKDVGDAANGEFKGSCEDGGPLLVGVGVLR